ncbi:zinc dependent phospholipase C family protein [Pseudoflavitalea rhizosphaerae]|uniref:zinc dependent phospholipase C family protein n=1 Tax=Pseudoflavitalea rhizosphaerae TaxID=1884793 RepID=UPI000F8E0D7D|nr:zinc dependent phospholipase C family protein [Pseudoflavitalea rhizosphaerae]
MRKPFLLSCFVLIGLKAFSWGFYAHKLINFQAVFLLPPEMTVFFKSHIHYLRDHATDPDRRRYIVPGEGPRHFIDLDHYQTDSLPRYWKAAVEKYSEDTLHAHGIVPWWLQIMQQRLTRAFKEKRTDAILKLSADIGHYIGDAHVPLHACSNYDGQQTNQRGIHALWESALPELLAEEQWQLFTLRAFYLPDPAAFFWERVLESGAAVDTVLRTERLLSGQFPPDARYAFSERNGKLQRQYSAEFAAAYHLAMNGMTERRLKQSIQAVAASWYTAWVNAGQPDLQQLLKDSGNAEKKKAVQLLNKLWLHEERNMP